MDFYIKDLKDTDNDIIEDEMELWYSIKFEGGYKYTEFRLYKDYFNWNSQSNKKDKDLPVFTLKDFLELKEGLRYCGKNPNIGECSKRRNK